MSLLDKLNAYFSLKSGENFAYNANRAKLQTIGLSTAYRDFAKSVHPAELKQPIQNVKLNEYQTANGQTIELWSVSLVQYIRPYVTDPCVDLVQFLHSLPNEGIVSKSGNYWYIKLHPIWQTLATKAKLIELITKCSPPPKVTDLGYPPQSQASARLYTPDVFSPAGMHISIPSYSLLLGSVVKFNHGKLEEPEVYDNVSQLNPEYHHLVWYTYRVHVPGVNCVHPLHGCHITLAVFGFGPKI